jgi:SAM-dependent methyltransferase
VNENITAGCSVLDIGCGHADWLKPELERAGLVVGADTDIAALRRNCTHGRVTADAQRLAFAAGSFDLVTCAWLLEHIDRPLALATEITRVLRPGGKVVFLTPNAWNYNVWLIRLVPGALHGHLAQRLYDRSVGDTYPVRYRINTPGAIDRTFTGAGLVRVQLFTNPDPTYLGVNRVLYWASCEIERLLALGPLRSARVHLLGVYTKP